MVDCSSSKRSVSVQLRLAIELVVLIGKMFPCRGKLCRIEAGLTRNQLGFIIISYAIHQYLAYKIFLTNSLIYINIPNSLAKITEKISFLQKNIKKNNNK